MISNRCFEICIKFQCIFEEISSWKRLSNLAMMTTGVMALFKSAMLYRSYLKESPEKLP
jgi:hypothetical protein